MKFPSLFRKSDTPAPAQTAAVREDGALRSPVSAAAYNELDDERRRQYRPVDPKYERLPLVCLILYGLCALCLILYVVQGQSAAFSDWFNLHVSAPVRGLLAALTAWVPFSVGELALFLSPLALGLALWYGIRYRCDTWRTAFVYVGILLSAVATIFSLFVLTFSAGYRGSTLDTKLGLEDEKISAEELYETAEILVRHINEETDAFGFGDGGFSSMPYTLNEMNGKLAAAYDTFCAEYDFIRDNAGKPKPVVVSEIMSYMHITGVYSFFTGESNINVGFPDYTIPYTAAHEMAHQRGVARENEANMTAFLVCICSDDAYIRYSGYLNMYEYVANALYSADKDLYRRASAHLNEEVRNEMSAYNRFYDKYKESTASKVSNAVNSAYLQTQKVESGTKSYGMVVDLTVAYYKQHPDD